MSVAYWMSHAGQGHVLLPTLNKGELAVMCCFVFLYLLASAEFLFASGSASVRIAPRRPQADRTNDERQDQEEQRRQVQARGIALPFIIITPHGRSTQDAEHGKAQGQERRRTGAVFHACEGGRRVNCTNLAGFRPIVRNGRHGTLHAVQPFRTLVEKLYLSSLKGCT